ncbi:MAG: transposase [Deltaproteobacteria bacterium]|nr:transposase [Deltaproteobacteria bacterium]
MRGLKRHLLIQAHGHPLHFTLTKANWHDQRAILTTLEGIRIGKRKRKPKRLGLDKGYDSEPLRRALRARRIIPIAPYRKNHIAIPLGRPPKDRHHARYCRQRWKVERSFAWLNNARRLDRFLERDQKTYRALMRVFFIRYYLNLLF